MAQAQVDQQIGFFKHIRFDLNVDKYIIVHRKNRDSETKVGIYKNLKSGRRGLLLTLEEWYKLQDLQEAVHLAVLLVDRKQS